MEIDYMSLIGIILIYEAILVLFHSVVIILTFKIFDSSLTFGELRDCFVPALRCFAIVHAVRFSLTLFDVFTGLTLVAPIIYLLVTWILASYLLHRTFSLHGGELVLVVVIFFIIIFIFHFIIFMSIITSNSRANVTNNMFVQPVYSEVAIRNYLPSEQAITNLTDNWWIEAQRVPLNEVRLGQN